jgi:hypothetical protein
MRIKLLCVATALAAALAMAGCVAWRPAGPQPPAPAASAPAASAPAASAPASFVFTSFSAGQASSDQGLYPTPVSYAEKRGDAFVSSVSVVNGAAVMKGQVGNVRGSGYAGVGMTFTLPAPADLSAYQTVKIRLASPSADTVRIRISGTDERILTLGCYPTFTLTGVKAVVHEYTVSLARLEPERYCADNARRLSGFINKVGSVEVADSRIANRPTEISVERIEFVRSVD